MKWLGHQLVIELRIKPIACAAEIYCPVSNPSFGFIFFVDLVIHNELKSYDQSFKAGNHMHAQSNHACSEHDLVGSASLPRIMWIDSKVLRI